MRAGLERLSSTLADRHPGAGALHAGRRLPDTGDADLVMPCVGVGHLTPALSANLKAH